MRHLSALIPLFLCWPASPAAGSEPQRTDFGRDVRPSLERSCWKCHGPDKQKGGVRFDRRQGVVVTGDSGKMAILPGRTGDSELIRRVELTDVAGNVLT